MGGWVGVAGCALGGWEAAQLPHLLARCCLIALKPSPLPLTTPIQAWRYMRERRDKDTPNAWHVYESVSRSIQVGGRRGCRAGRQGMPVELLGSMRAACMAAQAAAWGGATGDFGARPFPKLDGGPGSPPPPSWANPFSSSI